MAASAGWRILLAGIILSINTAAMIVSSSLASIVLLFYMCFTDFTSKLHQQKKAEVRAWGTWTVEWSNDGTYFALGGDDSTLRIYSAKTFTPDRSYKLTGKVRGLSWHPSEPTLAIATSKGISLLELKKDQVTKWDQLPDGGRAIGWNYDGSLLALADGHGIVQILNRQGNLLRSIKKYNNNSYLTMHWHPKKNILATGSDEIILFDTSGRQLQLIHHRKEATGVLTVRWHPSGDFFASGDYGHDKSGVESLLQFWTEEGKLLGIFHGSKAEYRNLRWDKKGTYLATASDALRIWSKEGKLLHTGKTNYNLWGVTWNPAGSLIITTSFDNEMDLWTGSGKWIKKIR